jgi:hypothetical protein
MWSWWKSKISGEVPLILNPSNEVLLKHIKNLKNHNLSGELKWIELNDQINFQTEVLKNINFFKPITYICEGEFLTEVGQFIELRFVTTSALHAAYFRYFMFRYSTSKIDNKWTIFHSHLDSLATKQGGVDKGKKEIWLSGSFHPDQLIKVFDYLKIKKERNEIAPSIRNQGLESWT